MPIKNNVSVDEVVEFLNELCEIDPYAMYAIFRQSNVECNKEMAVHPTVQVAGEVDGEHWSYSVGPLGILNSLFGIDDTGYGVIMVTYVPGKPESLKFARYTPSDPKI